MTDPWLARIAAALDTPGGIEGDAELSAALAERPELRDAARRMAATDEALAAWPAMEATEAQWEAFAGEVDARLDREPSDEEDATTKPLFGDEQPPPAKMRMSGGEFSLANLKNLDVNIQDPSVPDIVVGAPRRILLAPTGDRASLPAVSAKVAPRGHFLSIPSPTSSSAAADTRGADLGAPKSAPVVAQKWRGRIKVGLAATLGVAAGVVFGVVTRMDQPEQLAVAPGADAVVSPPSAAPTSPTAPALGGSPGPEGAAAAAETEPGAVPFTEVAAPQPTAAGPEPHRAEEAPRRMGRRSALPAPSPPDRTTQRRARARRGPPGARAPAAMSAAMARRAPGVADRATMGATRQAAPAPPAEGETPTRAQIMGAMRTVTPRVRACGQGGARHGVAQVRITVANSGRVTGVSVAGAFAGTAEGRCVSAAVRHARFPRFGRRSFTFTYPFQL